MARTELFVSLKIPDNVAISALRALHRMGFSELQKLDRYEYYSFDHVMQEERFKKNAKGIDILVNANKNNVLFSLEENKEKSVNPALLLVQDDSSTEQFAEKLRSLGLKGLASLERGTLWKMDFLPGTNARTKAIEIAGKLLMNENYQRFRLIEK